MSRLVKAHAAILSAPRPTRLPNRIVIGAIDSALNRVDTAIRGTKDVDWLGDLREERAALVEARNFIADKRKD